MDPFDNCTQIANPGQDDTDNDDCGNLCDADYNNDGVVGHPDLFEIGGVFGTFGNEEKCHDVPIPGCIVGFSDLGIAVSKFATVPGPSGTTSGTTACP